MRFCDSRVEYLFCATLCEPTYYKSDNGKSHDQEQSRLNSNINVSSAVHTITDDKTIKNYIE